MRISDWSSDVCSSDLALDDEIGIGRIMSAIEDGDFSDSELAMLRKQWQSTPQSPAPSPQPPVIGITGTGGAGKSSVTDELLNRFLASFPQMPIAVISVDPTRRRPGRALPGDRLRLESLRSPRSSSRSIPTHRQHTPTHPLPTAAPPLPNS